MCTYLSHREERVRDKREEEIAKPFVVVVVAATGFSGDGDVDLKFENSSREREVVWSSRERDRKVVVVVVDFFPVKARVAVAVAVVWCGVVWCVWMREARRERGVKCLPFPVFSFIFLLLTLSSVFVSRNFFLSN
jgi:hypothetical protein